LTYYFKTKDAIATQTFKDFLSQIYARINEYAQPEEKFFFRYYVHSFIYYNIILSDPHLKKYYYEIQSSNSIYSVVPDAVSFAYDEFVKEFKLRITPFQYANLKLSDLGARREMLLNYVEGKILMPIDDLVFHVTATMGRIWQIPEEDIYSTGFRAYELYKKMDLTGLRFL